MKLHTNTCLSDSFLKSYRPCNYIWPYIKKESLAQVFFLWNFSEQLLQKTVNDYFWTLRVDLEKKRLWNQKFIIEVIIKVLKKSVLVCNFTRIFEAVILKQFLKIFEANQSWRGKKTSYQAFVFSLLQRPESVTQRWPSTLLKKETLAQILTD